MEYPEAAVERPVPGPESRDFNTFGVSVNTLRKCLVTTALQGFQRFLHKSH